MPGPAFLWFARKGEGGRFGAAATAAGGFHLVRRFRLVLDIRTCIYVKQEGRWKNRDPLGERVGEREGGCGGMEGGREGGRERGRETL